jgi:hypothetical protein
MDKVAWPEEGDAKVEALFNDKDPSVDCVIFAQQDKAGAMVLAYGE